MNEFMDSVQHAISEGLNAQMAGGRESSAEESAEQKRVMTALRKKPGNELCADCGCADPNSVNWASINLGVLLCLDCSGVHRAMGTHVSKIRSANLDTKQWTDVMLSMFDGLGNAVVNQAMKRISAGGASPRRKVLARRRRSLSVQSTKSANFSAARMRWVVPVATRVVRRRSALARR
eukprot:COSAG04_NODE_121_length_24915_cov_61.932181_16_plen_178_part_00